MMKLVKERKTNVAILIDFQGFNMSLLQSLSDLDVKIFDKKGKELSLAEWSDSFNKNKKRIKFDTLHNESNS